MVETKMELKLAKKFKGKTPLCYCRKCGANGKETFDYAKDIIKLSELLGILEKLPTNPELQKSYIALKNCALCRDENEPHGVQIRTRDF